MKQLHRRLNATTFPLALALFVLALFATVSIFADDAPQAERVREGQEAPALSLPGSDGSTYTLHDLRGSKDVIVIFFRGTW